MGSGRFDADAWKGYATKSGYDTKTTAEIFNKGVMDKDLDPMGVKIRESRDSKDNPESTAIIIAQDVTGSMGMISDVMARKGVPTLVTNIYDRKPVTDPHVMCMAIGDVECDRSPLQVTQFEADIRIAQQLEKFYLEGGGGGNNHESYSMAWYFAAMHTSIDCFEKRGKKGYLFTIGDEMPDPSLSRGDLKKVLGSGPEKDLSLNELLTMASRQWEIFHVVVEEGSYCRGNADRVVKAWQEHLGQHVIRLADHTKLPEVIVSTIQVVEGASHKEVADSWDGSTSVVVGNAIRGLTKGADRSSGVVTL